MKKLLSLLTVTLLFLSSCVKQDLPQIPTENYENKIESSVANSSPASEPNNKAYVFVEPYTKYLMVAKYLKDSVTQLPNTNFLGFFVGPAIAVQNNVKFYFNMPHWADGRLPAIYTAEIPQTTGGVDQHGNTKTAYNFTTIKIPKGTVSGMGYVSILIPVSGMQNDTYKQKSVWVYEKIGNTLVTNGTRTGTNYTTNSVMYSYLINYQGNKIPQGLYRLYTTYPSTGFRMNFNSTKDLYLRGNGN
jgi:hypothetical protein